MKFNEHNINDRCRVKVLAPGLALLNAKREEMRKLKRELRKDQKFVCLDGQAYVRARLVGQDMLMRGQPVNADIVKGFEDEMIGGAA